MSRQRAKDETREKVRKAAWELFSEVGYDATTTKAIAARAAVASGTVFVHATDKADLLRAVVYERLEAIVEEGAGTVGDGPLVDEWLALFSRLLRFYEDNRRVSEAFLSVTMSPSLEGKSSSFALEVTMRFLGVLASLVERAKARGDVRGDVPSLQAAQAAFALYFSALSAWLQGFTTMTGAIAALRDVLELLLRGLAAARAAPEKPKKPKKPARRRSR